MRSRSQRCGRRGARLAHLLACAALVAIGDGAPGAVDSERDAIEHFVQRTREYTALRDRAVAEIPALRETASPEEIGARQRSLAAAIREARAGARRGDLFGSAGPALAALARRDWRERQPAERAALSVELPAVAAPAVNAAYPAELPLATFPPKLLEALPTLPEQLEYRFVGSHLILRDVEANLVVDVVPEVWSEAAAQ